jgi:DNA polymerase-3 subunit gamma/tau
MALIRLAFVRDLPSPAELVEALTGAGGQSAAAAVQSPAALPSAAAAPAKESPAAGPRSFDDILALVESRREAVLLAHLRSDVHLQACTPGRLEIRLGERAPRDLARRLAALLAQWTGQPWQVLLSEAAGAPSLREQEQAEQAERLRAAQAHPLVQAALQAFPDATIAAIRPREPAPAAVPPDENGSDGNSEDDA